MKTQSALLGLGLVRSPVGLAFKVELFGRGLLETVESPSSNMGVIQFQTEETQAAGFLTIDRKSNLDPLFSALERPGASSPMNPTRARIAIVLLRVFLCIGASL
jgi:hypothetical protein